jgi:VanZ family protein
MKINILLNWLAVLLWASIIYYLSSVPNLSSGLESDFFLRKTAHIFVYFVLTMLIFNALMKSYFFELRNREFFIKMSLLAFFLSFVYAISDEYHQTFVFGRHGDVKDIFIDSVGIAVSVLLFNKFKLFSGPKKEKK